jgi:hypothetical protein
MADPPGPIRRYLCGGMYGALGLAMATAGAMALLGGDPGALLELAGGLAICVAGSATIWECRRQGQLDATVATPVVAVERPKATMQRPVSSAEDSSWRSQAQKDHAFRPAQA